MENASKALIIAGEVLIGILILSLAVSLINNLQNPSKSYYKTMSVQEAAKINEEIMKNIVKPFKDDSGEHGNLNTDNIDGYITAQGIVTLKNLKEKLIGEGITINLSGTITTELNTDILKTYALDGGGNIKYYTVVYGYSGNLIKNITIGTTPYIKNSDGTRGT